mgnify:CR=1 FL=1
MTTDRLGLYNVALGALGERSLDSLTEDGEPRRELDAVWARGGGALRFFLEQVVQVRGVWIVWEPQSLLLLLRLLVT